LPNDQYALKKKEESEAEIKRTKDLEDRKLAEEQEKAKMKKE
jgi:hypothetical protein